jgi:hypothetical protein
LLVSADAIPSSTHFGLGSNEHSWAGVVEVKGEEWSKVRVPHRSQFLRAMNPSSPGPASAAPCGDSICGHVLSVSVRRGVLQQWYPLIDARRQEQRTRKSPGHLPYVFEVQCDERLLRI